MLNELVEGIPRERLVALVKRLGMTPLPTLHLERTTGAVRSAMGMHWWICGCLGGDCFLPGSDQADTPEEAIDLCEKWLGALQAPEKRVGGRKKKGTPRGILGA
jgi:hypothetical protein